MPLLVPLLLSESFYLAAGPRRCNYSRLIVRRSRRICQRVPSIVSSPIDTTHVSVVLSLSCSLAWKSLRRVGAFQLRFVSLFSQVSTNSFMRSLTSSAPTPFFVSESLTPMMIAVTRESAKPEIGVDSKELVFYRTSQESVSKTIYIFLSTTCFHRRWIE